MVVRQIANEACADVLNPVHLDPCLAFARTFGGTVQRRSKRAPAVELAAELTELTDEQLDEIAEQAEQLLEKDEYMQAADIFADAIERTADPVAANELSFKLAQVKWVAGSYTEAAQLFGQTAEYFSRRYGSDDEYAQLARYYLAKSNDEIGAVTAAIAAFRDVSKIEPDPTEQDSIARYLDTLSSLMRLHAAAGHTEEARAAAGAFRQAVDRYRVEEREGCC